jgi:hypothetical protein
LGYGNILTARIKVGPESPAEKQHSTPTLSAFAAFSQADIGMHGSEPKKKVISYKAQLYAEKGAISLNVHRFFRFVSF